MRDDSSRLSIAGISMHAGGMDEIEKFKEFLGPAAKGYSDGQLCQLRREMHEWAELLLDIYLQKKRQGASPESRADFDQPSATA